jgi:hypothetical protein
MRGVFWGGGKIAGTYFNFWLKELFHFADLLKILGDC